MTLMAAFSAAHAQSNDHAEPLLDRPFYYDLLHITGMTFVIIIFAAAILMLIKMILDSRLKHKLIEKGASESIVSQLLQPFTRDKENRNVNIKWFCILAGLGTGLALTDFFQPLGIHSLAMMSFSLSASFLGYYLFTKNRAK